MADFIVVGAGIVGASVAYSLAARGASVSLVDTSLPGSGVTGDSFAWIGDSGVVDGPTATLRRTATDAYRSLAATVDDVEVEWTGSVSWGAESPIGSAISLQPGQRLLSKTALAAIEPNLRDPPAYAIHAPGDGALDPVKTTEALVQGARDLGARVLLATAVSGVRVDSSGVTGADTSAGFLPARDVVLAAGVATPVLCASLGIHVPVSPSPSVLLRFAARPGLVRTVVSGAGVEVRQRRDGMLLAADAYTGQATQVEIERTARVAQARIASALRGAENIELLGARIGVRPMPDDGEPIVGPTGVRGLYVTVMHSAVTLAATVAALTVRELVDAEIEPALEGCRLSRFGQQLRSRNGRM